MQRIEQPVDRIEGQANLILLFHICSQGKVEVTLDPGQGIHGGAKGIGHLIEQPDKQPHRQYGGTTGDQQQGLQAVVVVLLALLLERQSQIHIEVDVKLDCLGKLLEQSVCLSRQHVSGFIILVLAGEL